MKTWLFIPLLVFGMVVSDASGRNYPYYGIDSLAFQSSDIILCDAGESVERRGVDISAFDDYYETNFTVVRTLKGELQPTEKISVEIPTLYAGTYLARKNKGVPEGSRALLFLERKETAFSPLLGPYSPVLGGVKVILEGQVHCYVQHDNPGPLYLALMAPENFRIADTEPYDEALLLKDLEIALEKAKHLERPTMVDLSLACRRLPRKSALPFEVRSDPFVVLIASFVVPFVLVALSRWISWWRRSRKR